MRVLLLGCWLFAIQAYGLELLDDEHLSLEHGQSLFNANYQTLAQPAAAGGGALDFFRMGLDVELSVNTNIRSAKLGCDGVNGAGCDIDLDYLALSGNPSSTQCASSERPDCNAMITRPFFEFAIKNPTSLASREVAGVRFSAEGIKGLLTLGLESLATPSGINKFSGYMKVQSDSSGKLKGYVNTQAGVLNAGTYPISGQLTALGLGGLAKVDFKTTAGSLNIPAMNNIYFDVPALTVNGQRQTTVSLNPLISLPEIMLGFTPTDNKCGVFATSPCPNYSTNPMGTYPVNGIYDSTYNEVRTQGGKVTALVTKCYFIACLVAGAGSQFTNVHLYGQITGLKANVTLNENLGFIHKLLVDSSFYLSLQKQNIRWPDTATDDVAQKGWWLSFKDPVLLGNVNPQDPVNLCPSVGNCVFPQISSQASAYLAANPPNTNDLGGLLTNGVLGIVAGVVPVPTPLSLTLGNIVLTGQAIVSNCYGTLKFC